MGSHPINLAIRFLLEVVAYAAMAYWGVRVILARHRET